MARSESISQLYNLLKASRYPVPMRRLEEQLGRSKSSIERYIQELRDTHMLEIEYQREENGYQIRHDPENGLELPSHLFTTQEVNALLLIEQIIQDLEPGFLKDDSDALKQHLAKIREKFSGQYSAHNQRIRMITIGKRQGNILYLKQVTQAVLQVKQITISYGSRSAGNNRITKRRLSPQRLTHYRDNWYLDAWCHEKHALRTFALDRINHLQVHKKAAKQLTRKNLDEYYTRTFGIFGGPVKNTAVLKFTPHRAQWVAEETWHPAQKGTWLEDGSYQLEIPYGSDLELLGDILKYGDQVEVIAPQELRDKLMQQVDNLVKRYQT